MRARPSRWIRRIVVLLLLGGAAVIARYTLFKPQPVPITVFRVATGRVEETVTNSKAGTIKSRRRATLSTEIGGRVVELPAEKGNHVRSGQVLVRLADADYRAQVDVQERALQVAGASADQNAPLLSSMDMREGRATAYVCREFACQEPTTDANELARQLQRRAQG